MLLLLNKRKSMHNSHSDGSSLASIAIGFIMAMANHAFGWLNNIELTSHWTNYFQALLMGAFGALGTFFVNETIKFFKRKIKKKKHIEIV